MSRAQVIKGNRCVSVFGVEKLIIQQHLKLSAWSFSLSVAMLANTFENQCKPLFCDTLYVVSNGMEI